MQKTKYGSACKAVPGYDVKIIKPDQSIAEPNEMGDIVVKLPLPPGTFPTLWNADKRYEENYMSNYKGYYQTYDADFTIIDMNKVIEIKNEKIESKCGWSPFNEHKFKGTPVATIINGKIKMRDGVILGDPEGIPLQFD